MKIRKLFELAGGLCAYTERKIMNIIESINNYLNKSDFWDAVFQVTISVSLMFLPFFALSWGSLDGETYDGELFWEGFASFFESGELGMPIFAITGSILYLLLRKVAPIGGLTTSLLTIIVIGIMCFAAFTLLGNEGFKDALPDYKQTLILYCFVIINIIWMISIWKSQQEPPSGQPGPDKEKSNAIDLANQARAES